MQTRYLYLLRFILIITDLLLINLCFFVSGHFSAAYSAPGTPVSHYSYLTAITIWLLSSSIFRLYSEETILKIEDIYRATWKSVVVHLLFSALYLILIDSTVSHKYFLLLFYILVPAGFLVTRFLGTAFEEILKRNFNIRKSVAVLGMNKGGIQLAAYLSQHDSFNFMGFLGDENMYVDASGELIQAAAEQLQTAARSNVKEVYVSLTPERMGDVGHLLKEAEKQCIRLKFVPDFSHAAAPFNIEHMGGFPILSVRKEPLEDIQNRFRKRFFDIVFSSLVIVFVLSWLYPLLAILIKMQSKGPVLFRQQRSGRDNQPFWCYKFRSMRIDNNDQTKQAGKGDDRITPIGRFMRKTSLDEFPQFINVLMGNMSIVGPRPHMLYHTEEYRKIIDQYMVRQFLKPGITGWAQVKGFRGETREHYLMEKRVEHDIQYMEKWSAMLDVQIIFLTILNVFKGEDMAY